MKKKLLSHSFCESGIGEQLLGCMILIQDLSQGRCPAGRQSAKSSTGEKGPFPQRHPHRDGDLAEGLSSLPSPHVFCVLMTWQLVLASKSDPGEDKTAAAAESLQSCLTLCDPIDGSPPGSPSLGFSRQQHWSGLPFPSPMHESEK